MTQKQPYRRSEKCKAIQKRYAVSERGRATVRTRNWRRCGHAAPVYARYTEALQEQGGQCAICGAPPSRLKALHYDHDHATGQSRGALCFKCNRRLANIEDTDWMSKALRYLAKYKEELSCPGR